MSNDNHDFACYTIKKSVVSVYCVCVFFVFLFLGFLVFRFHLSVFTSIKTLTVATLPQSDEVGGCLRSL